MLCRPPRLSPSYHILLYKAITISRLAKQFIRHLFVLLLLHKPQQLPELCRMITLCYQFVEKKVCIFPSKAKIFSLSADLLLGLPLEDLVEEIPAVSESCPCLLDRSCATIFRVFINVLISFVLVFCARIWLTWNRM